VDLFILTPDLRWDLANEAQLPARFLGRNKVPIGRFEVLMNLLDSKKSFKPLTIRFESSTMTLTNLTTSGVAVGVTVLAVDFEVEDRNQLNKYLH
jgi:hypothetical protein